MEFLLYTLRSLAYSIVDPILLSVLLMLAVVFYLKNKKIAFMQKMIIGESKYSPLELTLSQIVMGIFGGILGTLIITYLGVVYNQDTPIEILFMISILFMILKPRFVCFAYSSSALAIISLLASLVYSYTGKASPLNVNMISLFTFIGVLHIVEGLLVIIDGDKGNVPVFTNKDGKILGGFAFRRYWPIPIAIFLMTTSMIGSSYYGQIPNWWPIISTKAILSGATFILMPYYGVLGFNTVTFTKTKASKKINFGLGILIYGIITVLVAQLGKFGLPFELLVIIFVPSAHEFMLYVQKLIEEKGNPIYLSDSEGIAILEVAKNSDAFSFGIKSGDKIIEINNEKVESELQIYKLAKESYVDLSFKIKKLTGEFITFKYKPTKNKSLGMVLVPRVIKKEDVIDFEANKFREILNRLKNKENLKHQDQKNDNDKKQ